MNKNNNKLAVVLFLYFSVILGLQAQNPERVKISEETTRIIEELRGKTVESPNILIGGEPSKEYGKMKILSKVAKKEELLFFTKDSDPGIRCYAIWALAYNAQSSETLLKVLLEHLCDTSQVNSMIGCVLSKDMVGEFVIALLTHETIDEEVPMLDSTHLAMLDSALIFSLHPLKKAKDAALERVAPVAKYYSTIRALAKGNNLSALLALARYQKEEDISLIRKYWSRNKFDIEHVIYFYRAVGYFPHPEFFPFLKMDAFSRFDINNYEGARNAAYLYKAIASYQNEQALQTIKQCWTHIKSNATSQYPLIDLYLAVRPYKTAIYNTLFLQFWTDEQLITTDVFEYLTKEEELLALDAAKKSMQEIEKFSQGRIQLGELNYWMLPKLLEFIRLRDESFIRALIEEHALKNDFKYGHFLLKEASILKMNTCIEKILEKIVNESNNFFYLKFIRALLACKDVDITQKTLEAAAKNKLYPDAKSTINLILERYQ